MANENNSTRDEASARLRALLLERCPEHAVEIFDASVALAMATYDESIARLQAAVNIHGEKS